jgi:hypothetical protein
VSLEERVRRKLILVGILPKLFDLVQGVIGEAIEAAGSSGGFIRRLSMTAAFEMTLETLRLNRPLLYLGNLSLFNSTGSTKPNVQRSGERGFVSKLVFLC